jgi:hypothetical protein
VTVPGVEDVLDGSADVGDSVEDVGLVVGLGFVDVVVSGGSDEPVDELGPLVVVDDTETVEDDDDTVVVGVDVVDVEGVLVDVVTSCVVVVVQCPS